MDKRVALETLGCKVSQYESSHLMELLEDAGFRAVSFREEAELYIVHGCAVTSRACFQDRQLLRRARRLNPEACIVAAGCGAQAEPERLASEGLADYILGNDDKFDLMRWIGSLERRPVPFVAVSDVGRCRSFRDAPVRRMVSGRARAFLKVQDGCNAFCSYCIVPHIRGRSRSLPASLVTAQMERFVGNGYREVVLTGIHLGQWGRDLEPRTGLNRLLDVLAEGQMPERVRLSSLEPTEWEELSGELGERDWICPHFHVPLQSGDGEILRKMRRPYTPERYGEVVRELRERVPDAALGADVLAGFPGETERQFLNTYELIGELPLDYLHVFPYSPRPGTPAAEMGGRLDGREMKRRTGALHDLGERKRAAFRERFLGKTVRVLVEARRDSGVRQGTSENYIQVVFPAPEQVETGSIVPVRLEKIGKDGLVSGIMR